MSLNWRSSGDVTAEQWAMEIPVNSLIRLDGEIQATYNAAKGLTRLCLGQLAAESSYATNFAADSASNNNALNLRIRGQAPFQTFPNWAAGVSEWKARLLDPSYAYKDSRTVLDLVSIYAPSSDNNDVQAYVATVEGVMTRLGATSQATGDTPMTTTALNMAQDLIPLPSIIMDIITDAENSAWDVLGPKVVDRFVLHRQLGSNAGTRLWFRRGAASTGLTEFGSAHDKHEVFLWNSPLGFASAGTSANRAPWASGRYNVHGDAWGDGKAWVEKYGLNAVNGKAAAWEIDGYYDDPWSDESKADAAQACAHYAHNKGITYLDFPMVVEDGSSFTIWHQEITGPAEKICPGPVVMDATDAWIEQVRAIMKTAQTAATNPVVPNKPPKKPTYAKGQPITKGSARVWPYVQTLTVVNAYTPRQVASLKGRPTGPDAKPGDKVSVKWLLVAEDGSVWFVTAGGSRHEATAFVASAPTHQ